MFSNPKDRVQIRKENRRRGKGSEAVALEQMSSHLKFTKLKAMRCADANKSARAKLGRRQRGFPGWPTPCLVYAGQKGRQREIDRLAANDSWLLSPSASEIRTAELLLPKRLRGEPALGQRVCRVSL